MGFENTLHVDSFDIYIIPILKTVLKDIDNSWANIHLKEDQFKIKCDRQFID